MGRLAVTRALGDGDFKHEDLCTISCSPEIVTTMLQPEDEFIILASDGLWEVMDSQCAIEFVRDRLSEGRGNNLHGIAEDIVQHCLHDVASHDNVTAMIVAFENKAFSSEGSPEMTRKHMAKN